MSQKTHLPKHSGLLPKALIVGNSESEKISMAIAESPEEISKAYNLVYNEYIKEGFVHCSEEEFFRKKYLTAGTSTVFIGLQNNKILITLTSYVDDEFGLPADMIFNSEIQELRDQGRRLVEYGSLVSIYPERRASILFNRQLLKYHAAHGFDDTLIMIHPKHVKIYQYLYNVIPKSEPKPYPEVNGNLAVLCQVKLNQIS